MSQTILAVICARGGSTGVPGKNIKPIAGKPLIGWSIETAQAVEAVTDLIISTDDEAIAETAKGFGAEVPFMRPDALSNSTAGKFEVWKHALAEKEAQSGQRYDYFLDIDCTTPLLEAKDLEHFLSAFFAAQNDDHSLDGMFTVSASHRSPYFNLVEEDEQGFLSLSKKPEIAVEARQACPKAWDIVAGFYIFKANYIRTSRYLLDGKLKGFEVPREKSFDIDEPFDAELVDWLMRRQHGMLEREAA